MQFELKNKETIALFKLYIKAEKSISKEKDWRFINNIEKLTTKELRKIFYELNKIDYESEYLPKAVSKYRTIMKITEKMNRLKNFFINKYLTNNENDI